MSKFLIMKFTKDELFNKVFELLYEIIKSNNPDKWVDTFSVIRSTGEDIHVNRIILDDILLEMIENKWAIRHPNNATDSKLFRYFELKTDGIHLMEEFSTYAGYLEVKKDNDGKTEDDEKHIKALERKLLELQVSNEEFKDSIKIQKKKIMDLEVELKELEIPLKKDFILVSVGTAVISTLIIFGIKFLITGHW